METQPLQGETGPVAEVTLERASPGDAETLTEISRRSFLDDALAFRGVAGGPPGFDSVEWQRERIRDGGYYKIVADGRVVGGAIVYEMRRGTWELGRIYLDTQEQNRGVGRRAMALVHALAPKAVWQLDTPEWAVRNHHFYESLGYRRVGTQPIEGFNLILYERKGAK